MFHKGLKKEFPYFNITYLLIEMFVGTRDRNLIVTRAAGVEELFCKEIKLSQFKLLMHFWRWSDDDFLMKRPFRSSRERFMFCVCNDVHLSGQALV